MSDLNIEVKPMSRELLRKFSTDIRQALGLEGELYLNLGELFEFTLPKVVNGYVFDVQSIDEMKGDHGRAMPDENQIIIREDVYLRAMAGKGRDRMTMVHELGHLLLHKSDRMVHRRATGTPATYRQPEWQAKAFAGEFLIPHCLIGEIPYASQVAKRCGVSQQSALFQLQKYEEAGLIEKGQIIKDLAF